MTEKLVATDNSRVIKVLDEDYAAFEKDLASLINRHSMENGSDTPDFILAEYLVGQLKAFNETTNARRKWYGDPSLMDRIANDDPLPRDASLTHDMTVQAERRKNRADGQVESYMAEYGNAKSDTTSSSDSSDGGSE